MPGYVHVNEQNEVNRIGEVWKTDLEQIFKPVDLTLKMKRGEIKAALVFGEDPLSNKNSGKYFNNVEFSVVCDAFQTSTTTEADVVLPAATYIEQSGTYTRCDNTTQRSTKIINGLHDFENWQLISKLAQHFSDGFKFESSEEILAEIKSVDRFMAHAELNSSWLDGYFANGFSKEKFSLAECEVDLSTFDPVKETIHFQENYYLNTIKKKLM